MSPVSPFLQRSHAERNRLLPEPYQRVLIPLLVVALLALPMLGNSYLIYLLNLTCLAVIGAVGLNLLTGYCGQVSLGHASFMAIGGFVTAIAGETFGLPFWLAVPASCLVGAAVGFLVGIPALRFRGIYLAIATLAMHYAIIYLLTSYQTHFEASATAGISVSSPSLAGYVLSDGYDWYYLLLAVAAATVLFGLNLTRTHCGRAWVAIRDRDISAATLGINVPAYKLRAFVVSAALAALAGSLGAYFHGIVTAEGYTLELAILYLAMVIIGGMGSVAGTVLGAAFMTLLPFAVDAVGGLLPSAWRLGTVIYGFQEGAIGVVIILFLLFEPRGLIEIFRRLADYFQRWPFRYRELQSGG